MSDAISREGTSCWLEAMGYPKLAKAVMDKKRFPPDPRWIPCTVINQCFIPELKNVGYAGMLFTYRTRTGKLLVKETWIERGRIVGKNMNGTPIAYMPLPEPFEGVTE